MRILPHSSHFERSCDLSRSLSSFVSPSARKWKFKEKEKKKMKKKKNDDRIDRLAGRRKHLTQRERRERIIGSSGCVSVAASNSPEQPGSSVDKRNRSVAHVWQLADHAVWEFKWHGTQKRCYARHDGALTTAGSAVTARSGHCQKRKPTGQAARGGRQAVVAASVQPWWQAKPSQAKPSGGGGGDDSATRRYTHLRLFTGSTSPTVSW